MPNIYPKPAEKTWKIYSCLSLAAMYIPIYCKLSLAPRKLFFLSISWILEQNPANLLYHRISFSTIKTRLEILICHRPYLTTLLTTHQKKYIHQNPAISDSENKLNRFSGTSGVRTPSNSNHFSFAVGVRVGGILLQLQQNKARYYGLQLFSSEYETGQMFRKYTCKVRFFFFNTFSTINSI